MTKRMFMRAATVVVIAASHHLIVGWQGSSQTAAAQSQPAGEVVKLDPALDAIVPAGATIEKLAEGFGTAEGPLWTRDGALLFGDVRGNKIHRLVPGREPTVFRDPSGSYGADGPIGRSPGSPGLTFDRQGRLIICEMGNRRVTRLEANGQVTVLADKYDGKRLSSPNDVVVKSDGSIYFTDPPYGLQKQDDDPQKELAFNGVYRIVNGKVQLVAQHMSRPNGLSLSPDEKYLYVSNSDRARKILMRFAVKGDGTLDTGTVFLDLSAEKAQGVPDGLKVDLGGNVYLTGPGGVWIVSPASKLLGRLEARETITNVGWGGDDGRTLYLTGASSIYRIRLKTSGSRPCC